MAIDAHLTCTHCQKPFVPEGWGMQTQWEDFDNHGFRAHAPLICDPCLTTLRNNASNRALDETNRKRAQMAKEGWRDA